MSNSDKGCLGAGLGLLIWSTKLGLESTAMDPDTKALEEAKLEILQTLQTWCPHGIVLTDAQDSYVNHEIEWGAGLAVFGKTSVRRERGPKEHAVSLAMLINSWFAADALCPAITPTA